MAVRMAAYEVFLLFGFFPYSDFSSIASKLFGHVSVSTLEHGEGASVCFQKRLYTLVSGTKKFDIKESGGKLYV